MKGMLGLMLPANRSSHTLFKKKVAEQPSEFHDELETIFAARQQLKEQEKKLLKIGELAKICNVPRTTVRYYTQKGLISATKAANGYHYYTEQEIIKVKFILMHTQETKLYLDGIKRLLNETPFDEIERQVREWELAKHHGNT